MTMYDHSRDGSRTAVCRELICTVPQRNVEIWRPQYGKPCVLDEIAYEGNLPFGRGNISGEEMTRRFWEAYTRGGYGQHGETYENENGVIWWSHGGAEGGSPARIQFLLDIMEEKRRLYGAASAFFDETCCTNGASHPRKTVSCTISEPTAHAVARSTCRKARSLMGSHRHLEHDHHPGRPPQRRIHDRHAVKTVYG